ncbi:MAG: putative PEP-CTERM system TPR-repeat lipoprotein [Halieaceae bacterium]|jgi:putative PEP-CTERM system TPR-repeat lipoprotein
MFLRPRAPLVTRPLLLGVLLSALLSSACSPSMTESELLARAGEAFAAGDLAAAEVDVKTVLQNNVESAEARVLYGQIYRRQRNPAAAIEVFERSLAAQELPSTRMLLAKTYMEAGRSAELLDAALSEDYAAAADLPEFQAVLARAQLVAGDTGAARTHLAAAATLQDNDYVDLTRAYFAVQLDGDRELAKTLLEAVKVGNPANADAWSLRADLAVSEADWESAEAGFAKAAELNPFRLRDRMQLVNAQLRQGKQEEADGHLKGLERILPTHPEVTYMRGQLFLAAGDNENALDYFNRTLTDDSNHRGALLLAANANLQQQNLATAERQLSQYMSLYPGDYNAGLQLGTLWLQQGEPEQAEALARSTLESNSMDLRTLGLLAAALAAQGQHAQSAMVYEQIAVQQPDSSAVMVALGSQQVAAGDTTVGLEQLQAAVTLDGSSAQARQQLIDAYRRVGDLEAAEQAAQDYVDLNPENIQALIYLARVRVERDDLDGAQTLFVRILELDPGNVVGSGGMAAIALRAGDTDGAKAAFGTALAAHPDSLLTRMNLAMLHEQTGDPESMNRLVQEALTTNPEALQPRIVLAQAAIRDGRTEEAITLLVAVEAQHVGDYRLQQLLAAAYLTAGDTDKAHVNANKLVELRPEDPVALALAARVETLRGRHEEAGRHIEKALALQPDNIPLRKMLVDSLVQQSDLPRAKEEIAALPEAVQNETPILVLRGRLAVSEGKMEAAHDYFAQAFSQQRNNINLNMLISTQWELGEQEAVISTLEEWMKEFPDDVLTLNTLAGRELERGNDAEAIGHYETLLELDSSSTAVLNNLAWLLRESDTPRAMALVQQAEAGAPQNPSVKDTYAMIQMQRGAFDEALVLNARATDGAPQDREIRYNRAQILNAAGQKDAATALLRELVAGPVFASQGSARALLEELGGA